MEANYVTTDHRKTGSLCATSVFSVPLWFTVGLETQPQRHKGHKGCTEKKFVDSYFFFAALFLLFLLTTGPEAPGTFIFFLFFAPITSIPFVPMMPLRGSETV